MKLTFDEKIKEYQDWVLGNKKTPPKKDNIRFSDGGDMRSWAHNWRRYVRDFEKEHEDEPLPENLQKIEEMCEFIELSFHGELQLSHRKPDMRLRIKEYMEATRKLGRRPSQKDALTFKDGLDMVSWYNNANHRFGQNYTMEEIFEIDENCLHPFVCMKRKLCEEGYYGEQLWRLSHSTFEDKTKEYLEWVKLHKKKPSVKEKFSDGVLMSDWYNNQNLVLRSDCQKQFIPSNDRMKEIASFAWMENEILKVRDIYTIRKSRMTTAEKMKYFQQYIDKESFSLNPYQFKFPDGTNVRNWFLNHKGELMEYCDEPLSLESHVLEYLEMAKQEGHKLNTRDKRRLSNHHLAAVWLQNKERAVKKERETQSSISNLRMSELYVLALLDDYLYTLEHTPLEKKPVDTTNWVKRIKSSN